MARPSFISQCKKQADSKDGPAPTEKRKGQSPNDRVLCFLCQNLNQGFEVGAS